MQRDRVNSGFGHDDKASMSTKSTASTRTVRMQRSTTTVRRARWAVFAAEGATRVGKQSAQLG
jgi:hypothetical protein